MEIDYELFGRQIKRCRHQKNISQEQLAEMAEMSVTMLQYIETGERHGSMDSIFSIACALEVPVDTFLFGQGDNFKIQYSTAFHELFSDCNRFEAKVIYDIALATKNAYKSNARLLHHSRKNR